MNSMEPKYIGSFDGDGLLNKVYQVHGIYGDKYVLEAISYFDLIYLVSCGYEPSKEPVLEMVREKKLSEIENAKPFYSWNGIAAEFIRTEKERDRQYRQEKRDRQYRREDGEIIVNAPPDEAAES